jgi:hypothetical protein
MTAQSAVEGVDGTREYSRAFLVGWRLAQIQATPIHQADLHTLVGANNGALEILTNFDSTEQAQLVWNGLDADLSKLPGGNSPEITSAKNSLWEGLKNPAFNDVAIASAAKTVLTRTVMNAYVANPSLAKAVEAGRQLAEYVFGPEVTAIPVVPVAPARRLSAEKVDGTCSLLADLQTRFPSRATTAVAGSLVYWQRWAADNGNDAASVGTALLRQGERWRSLMTGEASAEDLLDLRDYREAVAEYLHQVVLLCQNNQLLWGAIAALLAATGGSIYCIVTFAPKGAAVIAGVIAAAAGALGITWKTVAATAGKVAALLERPMLDDGLTVAVQIAAFIPAGDMNPVQIEDLRRKLRDQAESRMKALRKEEQQRRKQLHKAEKQRKKQLHKAEKQRQKQATVTDRQRDRELTQAETEAATETPAPPDASAAAAAGAAPGDAAQPPVSAVSAVAKSEPPANPAP